MSITATTTAMVTGSQTRAVTMGGSAQRDFSFGGQNSWADGSGANQVNKMFAARYTIGASATESIDLAGSLEDDLGQAVVFTAIKAILIKHVSGVNSVIVGNGGVNSFLGPFGGAAHTVTVPPNGRLLLERTDAAGWTVTAATGDILALTNSAAGTSVVVDVVLLGI